MEAFATSGFELGALLAPELAGTATGAGQGARADPHAAEPGAAPFALALAVAGSVVPEAASAPESGKFLPLVDRALVAARAIDSNPAPLRPAQNPASPASEILGSGRTAISELSASLLAAATAKPLSTPTATGGDVAGPPPAVTPASADPVGLNAAPATASLDGNAAKLVSTVSDQAADVIRLAAKQIDAKVLEPPGDSLTQRSSDQLAGRGSVVRDALPPFVPEQSRPLPSATVAAESANTSAAMPIARNLQRLETGARASDAGAGVSNVAAIVTEGNTTQTIDAPKIMAELPVGNEARLPSALAERLHWMIDQNLGEARIKLNPPQLGAIDIKITMADDQTFVQFTASQAGARDIIESALPRLRDLLGSAGLSLGGATVGGETTNREQSEVRWSATPELEPLDIIEPVVRTPHLADGRIDIFA